MKRRIALVLGTVGLLVVIAAGVALAASINCGPSGGPCTGTGGADVITGSDFADNIAASAGDDVVNARGGNDRGFGDGGDDVVNGGTGRDHLESGGGSVASGATDDTLNGGDQSDVVSVVDFDVQDTANGGSGDEDICLIDSEAVLGEDAFANCDTVYTAD